MGNQPMHLSRRQAEAAGAFYTPSDITAYITEVTILPFLLDTACNSCAHAFPSVWQLLRVDPNRYIRPAVRRRARLPSETEVEHQARQERCRRLRRLLRAGQVSAVNDLVTLNLDCRQFVLDLVESPHSGELAATIAHALADVTILDPTCGDGAFLLAALALLEELAVACARRAANRNGLGADPLPALRRSLLTRNLYGIDRMPAAVMLCRANLLGKLQECGANGPIPKLSIHEANVLAGPLGTKRFDVIIGNPPYVPVARTDYAVQGYATERCPDIYAWVLERSTQLLKPGGRLGMIVPLSLSFSGGFSSCRQLLFDRFAPCWFASFGRIPSALFDFDVRVRNTIFLGQETSTHTNRGLTPPARHCYATRLHRWFDEARPDLFAVLDYAPIRPECWAGRVPKPNTARLAQALEARRLSVPARLGDCLSLAPTPQALYFKKTAYNWLTFCRQLPPCFDAAGGPIAQTQFDALYFSSRELRDAALLFLNGKWAYAYWCIVGDDFHVARWMFGDFPIDLPAAVRALRRPLLRLAPLLEAAMGRATNFKRNAGKRVGSYNLVRCREITDQSDRLFSAYLGLQDAWDDVELLVAQIVRTHFSRIQTTKRRNWPPGDCPTGANSR